MNRIIITTLAIILAASASWAAEAKLEWDAPVGDPPASYKVYYGLAPNTLDQVVEGIALTEATITGLLGCKTYFFRASAVYPDGSESEMSSGAYKDIDCPPGPTGTHISEGE